jgi:hypothetical protein
MRSRPGGFKPDIEELSLASIVNTSKLRIFSSERAATSKSALMTGPKHLISKPRMKQIDIPVKTVNSIPFTRENDDIEGIGPGSYDPNIAVLHRKAPATKMMKSTLLNRKTTMNNVNRIISSVSKHDKVTIHEQISNHKLDHLNAVFASKTSRKPKLGDGPGPGSYTTTDGRGQTMWRPVKVGFGSTSERSNLVNQGKLYLIFRCM